MRYLYHLTTSDAVQKIMQTGIVPTIGERSRSVGETAANVYLCDHKSILSWKIVLGLSVVIRVNVSTIPEDNLKRHVYSCGNESLCKTIIPHTTCHIVNSPYYDPAIMRKCCLSYMDCISNLCLDVMHYYLDDHLSYTKSEIYDNLQAILPVLQRLDYSVCTLQDLRKELVDESSDGYSFLDTYYGTKLYDMLLQGPKDSTYNTRHALHEFIENTFQRCLDTKVGEYTD